MKVYAFWNNKGGTGKTSLAFQAIARYAEINPKKKILTIDLCPQANLSELMLGGLNNGGSDNLLEFQNRDPRCTIGGYFQLRLPSPYQLPNFKANQFIERPHNYNKSIPANIDIICGDPLLELQANAVNTLANANIPGTNAWISVMNWLKDFISKIKADYETIFIDCNPSFSFYTQIGLATANKVILPVMADDSSRRAIQNAFSLVYGLHLPSRIYSTYMFSKRLKEASQPLPKVHLIIKNRITRYMGPASAYATVLKTIDDCVQGVLTSNPDYFTFKTIKKGLAEVKDFNTAGVVAFARGEPFYSVSVGRQTISGNNVQVKQEYLDNCREDIDMVVSKLESS